MKVSVTPTRPSRCLRTWRFRYKVGYGCREGPVILILLRQRWLSKDKILTSSYSTRWLPGLRMSSVRYESPRIYRLCLTTSREQFCLRRGAARKHWIGEHCVWHEGDGRGRL